MKQRPYANHISKNEWINYVVSYAFQNKQAWSPSEIHRLVQFIGIFPVTDDESYTSRIMKNLASKEILQPIKKWDEHPILHYRLTAKGTIHFYTGDKSVQKKMSVTIAFLETFVNKFESALPKIGDSSSSSGGGSYIGLRDYYEWLLLTGTKYGNRPSDILKNRSEYSKPPNKEHFYKTYRELVPMFISDSGYLTMKGLDRLTSLEKLLLNDIRDVKTSIEKMKRVDILVRNWIKNQEYRKDQQSAAKK